MMPAMLETGVRTKGRTGMTETPDTGHLRGGVGFANSIFLQIEGIRRGD
jgi:hypothetical protein